MLTASRARASFAPINLAFSAELVLDSDRAVCPVCGGDFDVCQPNVRLGDELVGTCVECERSSFVFVLGSMAVVMLLPSRDEIGDKVARRSPSWLKLKNSPVRQGSRRGKEAPPCDQVHSPRSATPVAVAGFFARERALRGCRFLRRSLP